MAAAEVRAHQRRRLCRAAIEQAAAHGIERVTLRSLCSAAGVSSASFYRSFADLDDCFSSTGVALLDCALERAATAASRSADGEDALEAAVRSLCADVAADPEAARFLLVERPSAPEITTGVVDDLDRIGSFLAACLSPPSTPPGLRGHIATGVLRVARKTAMAGRAAELPRFASELAGWLRGVADTGAVSLLHRGSGRREPDPFPARRTRRVEPRVKDAQGQIILAAGRLATREGYASISASRIRREAGVPKRIFDLAFSDPDSCYLEAIELRYAAVLRYAVLWAGRSGSPARRVYRATLAICAQLARDPAQARLILLGIMAPGRAGLVCREGLISSTAEGVSRLLGVAGEGSGGEASVAAIWSLAAGEVAAGRASGLPWRAPLLAYLALVPTIGAEAALAAVRGGGGRGSAPRGADRDGSGAGDDRPR